MRQFNEVIGLFDFGLALTPGSVFESSYFVDLSNSSPIFRESIVLFLKMRGFFKECVSREFEDILK
jgi:hypothetical protein